MHPLQEGQGLVGKAYLSRKPCFCRDVAQFNPNDYPLVYYAFHARLTQSFAICLHHTCSNNYYIIELFLAPGDCGDPRYILRSIMTILREFPNLEVASGELHVEVIQPSVRMCHAMLGSAGNGGDNSMPSSTSHRQAMGEQEDASSGSDAAAAVNDAKKRKTFPSYPRDTTSTGISISYGTFEQHFGRKLEDVADSLGVSRSTVRRNWSKHGRGRWPSHKRNRANLRQDALPRSHLIPDHDQLVAPTIDTAMQDANTMTVKAKYRKEYFSFGLPISSGMAELMEKLSERLKSKTETYKIRYTDGHGDPIRIACDEDLQKYINACISLGLTTINISVGL